MADGIMRSLVSRGPTTLLGRSLSRRCETTQEFKGWLWPGGCEASDDLLGAFGCGAFIAGDLDVIHAVGMNACQLRLSKAQRSVTTHQLSTA